MEELTLLNIGLVFAAYLLGSLPFAVWVGRLVYGVDVRDHGSGNAGATNTFRVLGKTAGLPVLLLDMLKGFMAVRLAYLSAYDPELQSFMNLQIILGLTSIVGHIFPLWARFRGGKGIATLLGAMLAIHFPAAIISMIVFALVFILTNYVSLSSILASLMFPISIILVFHVNSPTFIFCSLLVWILVLVTHQKNIERLLNREESKIFIIRRKDRSS